MLGGDHLHDAALALLRHGVVPLLDGVDLRPAQLKAK